LTNPVLGVNTMVGPAAEAVVAMPRDVRPPRIKVPMAILVIKRLIVYVLSIVVVTSSLCGSPR
jgi:hypothetical protein